MVLFIVLPGHLRKKKKQSLTLDFHTMNHFIGHDNAFYNEDKLHHQERDVSGKITTI